MNRKGVFWELKNPNSNSSNEKDDKSDVENAEAQNENIETPKPKDEKKDINRIFQKFQGVGPVTIPVEEATEFMAGLEHQKLTTTDLRKKVTDLTYENKYWRAYALALLEWQEKAKEKLSEAKAKGESEVTLPPLPRDVVFHKGESEREEGDVQYMREFAKFIGPYIAIGKYLRESEGGSANSNANYAGLPSITKYDAEGNRYEIPIHYAGFFGITPETFSQAKANTPDFLTTMPTVKKVEPDGSTTFYPAWMYLQMQAPSSHNPGQEEALTKLTDAIAKLHEKLSSLPSIERTANEARVKMKEDLNFFRELRDIFTPTSPENQESKKKEALEIERIKQEEETKREKEKTQQRAFDTWSKLLTESEGEGEEKANKREKELHEKGRAFIDKIMKKTKEISSSEA